MVINWTLGLVLRIRIRQTYINDFPAIKASKDDFPLKMGYFQGLMECNHRLMDIMIMMKIMAFH